jgi:hypothetical protein
MSLVPRALLVLALALAACRGGVKSGLRTTSESSAESSPAAPAPTPPTSSTRRIEYYKISDG